MEMELNRALNLKKLVVGLLWIKSGPGGIGGLNLA